MLNRGSSAATVAISSLLCGFLQMQPALAQGEGGDDHGGGEKHVIIKTGDGTKEIHINLKGDPSQFGDAQVFALKVGADGNLFSFMGSPNEMPFGDALGPMGFAVMGGANGTIPIIDPGYCYVYQLINRSDVRSDLFLDSKQKELIEAIDVNEQKAAQKRMQDLQDSIKAGGTITLPAKLEDREAKQIDSDPVVRRAMIIHELMPGTKTPTKKDLQLAAILTDKQVKRLKELDLQFRGPLAMGIKPVADKTLLVTPEAPAVSDLLKQYREFVAKTLGVDRKETRTTNPDGSTSISINSNITNSSPDEMKSKLEKAHEEIENSRRTLGQKAIKTITHTEQDTWKTMIGARFDFQHLN